MRTYLRNTVLSEANLANTNLAGANLSNTNFKGENLVNANLSNADFSGANLVDSDLSNADLSSMVLDISSSKPIRMVITDIKNADLSNANCRKAKLKSEQLQGVSGFDQADFRDTGIKLADLPSGKGTPVTDE